MAVGGRGAKGAGLVARDCRLERGARGFDREEGVVEAGAEIGVVEAVVKERADTELGAELGAELTEIVGAGSTGATLETSSGAMIIEGRRLVLGRCRC